MPELTSYTKDTESNILANPPTADGQLAFATDTYKFYISDGTNWRSYQANKVYGNYSVSESSVVSSPPLFHFDASDSSTVLNGSDSQPSNGDGVASITCKATGKKMISDFATEQPTYVSATGTPIMGETTGDARIGGLNTLQFDGAQMLAYDYNGQTAFNRFAGFTGIAVFRAAVSSGNSSGWNPVFGGAVASGPSFIVRDLYDYASARMYISGAAVSRSFSSAGLAADFAQNNPTLVVLRTAVNKSTYVQLLDFNVNNTQVTDTTSANYASSLLTLQGMMLGAQGNFKAITQRFHGEIGEFLFFDSMFNNSAVNTVANYLASKWGLNWSDL